MIQVRSIAGVLGKLLVLIALAMLSVIFAFYWNAPEHILNLARMPAIMLIGTFLLFLLLWPVVKLAKIAGRSNEAAESGLAGSHGGNS